MINDLTRKAAVSLTVGMTTFLYALKYPFIHDETAAAGSANASILIGF